MENSDAPGSAEVQHTAPPANAALLRGMTQQPESERRQPKCPLLSNLGWLVPFRQEWFVDAGRPQFDLVGSCVNSPFESGWDS